MLGQLSIFKDKVKTDVYAKGQILKTETCPTCNTVLRTYKRKLGKSVLRPLTNSFEHCQRKQTRIFHTTDCVTESYKMSADVAKARYYGLIEPIMKGEKIVNGYWKITDIGLQFFQNEIALHEYFVLRNAELVRFEGKQKLYKELI